MLHRWIMPLFAGMTGIVLWLSSPALVRAQYGVGGSQGMAPAGSNLPPALNRFWYYPYYYYPHSYWPTMGPRWPEPVGAGYQRPPAYMAYPPLREPQWRYEYFEPQHYYRGSHFWLDQF